MIPAAIIGLAPTRRRRLRVIALGLITGLPLMLGSVVSSVPWLAVTSIFVLAVCAVILARIAPIGSIALVLSLPMVGVGLSYGDRGVGLELSVLLVAGSVYAAAVSMLWPARDVPAGERSGATPSLDYGVRLGAAAAIAAAVGFMFDLEHVGWATAAVLLVMRPGAEQTTVRMVGRLASVCIGGAVAVCLVASGSNPIVYSAAIVACVAAAAATHTSRWYVTSAFTTFLVLLLLVSPSPRDAGFRLNERLVETVLGVGLAWLFAVVLPAVLGSGPESEEHERQQNRIRP